MPAVPGPLGPQLPQRASVTWLLWARCSLLAPPDTVRSLGCHTPSLSPGVRKGLMPPDRGSGEVRRQCPLVSGVKERPALIGHTHHHSALATCTPVSGRQVLTSPPIPVVPPGTQGPQLLLAWCPPWEGAAGSGGWANNAPSGPLCACTWHPGEGWGRGHSGLGGRSASEVGTAKAGGEKQRVRAGGEEREVGHVGRWPPDSRPGPRDPAPDPMAAQMASYCPRHSLGLGIWGQRSRPRGLLGWRRPGLVTASFLVA